MPLIHLAQHLVDDKEAEHGVKVKHAWSPLGGVKWRDATALWRSNTRRGHLMWQAIGVVDVHNAPVVTFTLAETKGI
jgi:hypothetical protein